MMGLFIELRIDYVYLLMSLLSHKASSVWVCQIKGSNKQFEMYKSETGIHNQVFDIYDGQAVFTYVRIWATGYPWSLFNP